MVEPATKKSKVEKALVLHLCGSRVSEYYEGVSAYYASQCFNTVITQDTYRHMIGMVQMDGSWSFPTDFSDEAKACAKKVSLTEAMQKIKDLEVSVVNPIMFCLPGMTTYRALFDALEIPLVGCNASVMALSTNKAQSRAVVAAAGVRVPEAELLKTGDRPKMEPPFVLKPCNEDNSLGVTLYTGKDGEDLSSALETAFKFDTEVLCERFIPLGREVRCAVLEKDDGSLEMLPCLEYFLSEEHPIRASNDKLVTDSRGVPTTVTTGGRKCPADIDAVLRSKLEDLCVKSHKALGCRDYSLYDVRVDPNGEPYFLEACLYCSFAPKSVIIAMSAAQNVEQQTVFEMLVSRSIKRKQQSAANGQLLGMKAA
jgi:D-alanine-D-alanine ligase